MQKIISLLNKEVTYPLASWIAFRFLFGIYLAYYFVATLPYVSEIYSNKGLFPDYSLNLITVSFFPNIFYIFDSPAFIVASNCIGFIISLFFAFGFLPRVSALFLWYLQTALFGRNVLTAEPSLCYTGLLLLFTSLLPVTPTIYSFAKEYIVRKKDFIKMPFFVFYIPVYILAISFFVSAVNKMGSISWLNGTALKLILLMPIAEKTNIVNHLVHSEVVVYLSFLALLSQLVVLPLFLVGDYRSSLYISIFEFLFAFITLSINQVTLGMILFFTFFIMRDFDGTIIGRLTFHYKKFILKIKKHEP